ncbi:MAG: Nudix family hydrolase [Candidatus Thiodiazotropha sp. (ex Clathrolucina costata)]|nr:Nudix family hydrolase [Candidatus Thiodiazotropha taylori]MCG7862214.1 Nudix family hydrolase [Candidatus Thiodiazotropha endolucinida]
MIHVVAAAIFDSGARVLVTRRADHLHQGGLWEFPGGKCEPGESNQQALARELKEELGIVPLECDPLIRVRHDYGDRNLLLEFFRVTRYQGEASGLEGQPLKWLLPEEMEPGGFPAADRPVITALQLPSRYLITGGDSDRLEDFLQRLDRALDRGVGIVQLRAHGLTDIDYRELLSACLPRCHGRGVKLIVNRPERVADWRQEADGVHFTARQLMALAHHPSGAGLLGASCHNPEELARAAELELDYALLSPVEATGSHPHAQALGWFRFTEWVDRVNIPVYALGGMQSDSLRQAKLAGAQGIAGISTFWGLNR